MTTHSNLPETETPTSEIIFYQPDETIRIEVRMEDDTVWLTQAQIAELFGTKRQAITKHIKNIYNDDELTKNATCSILELVQQEGGRRVTRKVDIYNLDMIISIGYRVNSKRGIAFRKWATNILKTRLIKKQCDDSRLHSIEIRLSNIETAHQTLYNEVHKTLPPTEGIFYSGQVFDAYVFVSDLITRATSRIILIDNYIDTSVLTWLDKRHENVSAHIYTHHISAQMQLDIQRHNAQYPPIPIDILPNIHDRFLIIDDSLYHIGASIKDLGKKLFAFTKMEMKADDMMRFIGI